MAAGAEARGAPRPQRARAHAVARDAARHAAGLLPAASSFLTPRPRLARALEAAHASPAQRAGASRSSSGARRIEGRE
eukprot:5885735-Alexandrium_andersonii.AAC.1